MRSRLHTISGRAFSIDPHRAQSHRPCRMHLLVLEPVLRIADGQFCQSAASSTGHETARAVPGTR